MARDLSRMYVSHFNRTLSLSAYPACGSHGLLPEDKDTPDRTVEECKAVFEGRTGKLMRYVNKRAAADWEIGKIGKILEAYRREGLSADWSDREVMEAFCGRTRAVQELLERRRDINFRYAHDFCDAVAVPVCHAYAAHLQMEETLGRKPDEFAERGFANFLDRIEDHRRLLVEKIMEELGGRGRDTFAEMVQADMMVSIASSRQEFEDNMAAFHRQYGSATVDAVLKERADSCREAILSADWGEREGMERVYNLALSEAGRLEQRLDSLE